MENLPHDNLWVVGGKPEWYTGNYIFAPSDPTRVPLKFNREKIGLQTIADSDEISDDFILMNDDFFVLQYTDTFTDWNGGLLSDKIDLYKKLAPHGIYTNCLKVTYDGLLRMGFDNPLDFEMHVPMNMNKDKLNEALKDSTSLWRSVYGNMFITHSDTHEDVKVYRNGKLMGKSYDYLNNEQPFLSTIDDSFEMVRGKVLEVFSEPSPYEHP
jgi:hypothetical protein